MLVNGIVWCIAWWAALLLCKRSLAVFVGSLELLSNCPQCVLLQISVWLYVIRDRDTRTHTRIHTCRAGCAPLLTPQRNCDPFLGAIDTTHGSSKTCCCGYSDNSNSCCYGHISVKVVWPKDVGISMTTIRLQQMWIIADVHFLFPNRRPMRSMVFHICRIYSLCASWSVTRNNFRRRHKTAKATTKRCDYDIYKIICFVLHKWQKQYAQRTDSKTGPSQSSIVCVSWGRLQRQQQQ